MNRKTFLLLIAAIVLPFKKLWARWTQRAGLYLDADCTIPFGVGQEDPIAAWTPKEMMERIQTLGTTGRVTIHFHHDPTTGMWEPKA